MNRDEYLERLRYEEAEYMHQIGVDNDGFFKAELPDIQTFIRNLNLLDENINKAVRDGLHKGAERIASAQRRLAPYNLSQYIAAGDIYVTKKGNLGVICGYVGIDYKELHGLTHSVSPFVLGRIFEFGRPGNSSTFRKDKYRYYHRYNKRRAKKTGGSGLEIFKGLKGAIQPQPHIRRGFDEAIEEAVQILIDSVTAEIDKLGD